MNRRSFQKSSNALTEAFQIIGRMRTRRSRHVQPKNGMNKTEAQYAAYLSACADVVSWKYEPMSFWLADNLRYTPDFLVEYVNGEIHVVDVKAVWRGRNNPHVEDDSLVKLKMMAQEYGMWFSIKMVWFEREGKAWKERYFEPVERSGEGAAEPGSSS